MNLNGPICFNSETVIRAALFAKDAVLPEKIRTPFGMLKFIQFVGITDDEYELTWEWSSSGLLDVRVLMFIRFQSVWSDRLCFDIQFIRSGSPLLVTDLERQSMLQNKKTLNAIRTSSLRQCATAAVFLTPVEFIRSEN